MSKHANILIIIVSGLFIVGFALRMGAVLALGIPFVIYLAAGFAFSPESVRLQVDRTLSTDRVLPNEPVTVFLKITNQGPAIENLCAEDILPAGLQVIAGSTKIITPLKTGETVEISYTLRGGRGNYHLSTLRITASDHLGLVPKTRELPLVSRFLVLPNINQLPEAAIRPRRTRVFPGSLPANTGGPGVAFFGVREYQSGDPMRWINDRQSARQEQTWYVNEFEQERAVDVGLILDCRTETNLFKGNADLLEHGIQAAAILADTFLRSGNRVGLLIYGGGRNWVHPGYGKIQRERIMQALARVRLYKMVVDKDLAYMPTRLFPARSQLVLVSSLLYQDLSTLIALRSHGYPLLVISPDPIDFERKLLPDTPAVAQAARISQIERDFLVQQLRRSGARVFEWQVDQPFHQAAHYALTRAGVFRMRHGVLRA